MSGIRMLCQHALRRACLVVYGVQTVYTDTPSALLAQLFLSTSEREYTMKQYRPAPSKGKSITRNQRICVNGCESSKRNKKNSIPTIVIPAPSTPTNMNNLTTGTSISGI